MEDEQSSVRITWDVFVSSLHFGRRGCILADGWAALHRGDQREGDRGQTSPSRESARQRGGAHRHRREQRNASDRASEFRNRLSETRKALTQCRRRSSEMPADETQKPTHTLATCLL